MKILLLGELSGVHRELRGGLERRGHEVVQAHSGDSYRKFSADIAFAQTTSSLRNPLSLARELASQLGVLSQFTGFDVVQFISPKFFHWRIQEHALRWLRLTNRTVIMINAGCSSEFNRVMREQAYGPCSECKRYDLTGGLCPWERSEEKEFEERVYRLVSGLVATHFFYHEPLRRLALNTPLFHAPLPMDLIETKVTPPRVEGRLRIYYGETRSGFKGGTHIKPALERLSLTHGKEVEVVQSLRLPFDEYLQRLDEIDVLIDQANSAGMGMNALYAMARGKVALTGAEAPEMDFLGATASEVPALNILPSAEQIYRQLVSLIEDRRATAERGLRSRKFIERFHSADVVATRYEDIYDKLLRK